MWISIEGNKASVVEKVLQDLKNKNMHVYVQDEQGENGDQECLDKAPLSFWKSLFKRDKSRWAFGLQMKILAFLVRINAEEQNKDDLKFIEGSCLSCRHVYGQMYYNSGFLSSKEWELLKHMCDLVKWTPDVLVYLHSKDETEIKEANDENNVERLEFLYHNMLKFYSGKVIYIDASDISDETDIVSTIIEKASDIGIVFKS